MDLYPAAFQVTSRSCHVFSSNYIDLLIIDLWVAANKIGARGNGTVPKSCFYCDPAVPQCAPGCQKLVKQLYYNCDSVCLPDGYYFDTTSGVLMLESSYKYCLLVEVIIKLIN